MHSSIPASELAPPPPDLQSCARCGASANEEDEFCSNCGESLVPTSSDEIASDPARNAKLKEARGALAVTSVIFVLSGIVFFFLQRPDAMDALANLEGYDASEIWSEPVEGEYVTVGVLRRMVQVELWSVLVLNLVLGAVMVGLFVWAKRAAFPALVTGASIYVAVQVLNAIVDPRTLGQGLVMRIIVIMAFYKGVKAASELRGPARATVEK